MDTESFKALLSAYGQEALRAARALHPTERTFLHDFDYLNKSFSAPLAKAALETAILQAEAVRKFPDQSNMYFTREALEQASNYEISQYRAKRYAGFSRIIDLGCSVGSDSLAFSNHASVVGIDLDYLRLLMASANRGMYPGKFPIAFIQADLMSSLPLILDGKTALFFDPGRRKDGKRAVSVHRYLPPLSILKQWLPVCEAIGVKISPAVNLLEISYYDTEIEFISLRGDLKEAVLWFGKLKSSHRRATILPGEYTLTGDSSTENLSVESRLADPLDYIYEPDPAVMRAGLIKKLAVELNAFQLDEDIAYLTSAECKDTPFARVWKIEEWMPFGLKRLRRVLREKQVGKVVVKKRGSPLVPEKLIHDLHLNGSGERILFLTHLRGKPIVILALPCS